MKEVAEVALEILNGLLASGHYTGPAGSSGEPGVLRQEHGQSWQQNGHLKQYTSYAVKDAFELANEFMQMAEQNQIKHVVNTDAPVAQANPPHAPPGPTSNAGDQHNG